MATGQTSSFGLSFFQKKAGLIKNTMKIIPEEPSPTLNDRMGILKKFSNQALSLQHYQTDNKNSAPKVIFVGGGIHQPFAAITPVTDADDENHHHNIRRVGQIIPNLSSDTTYPRASSIIDDESKEEETEESKEEGEGEDSNSISNVEILSTSRESKSTRFDAASEGRKLIDLFKHQVGVVKRALKVTPEHLKKREGFYLVPHYADKIYGSLSRPPAKEFTKWLSAGTIRELNQSFREYYRGSGDEESGVILTDVEDNSNSGDDLTSAPHFLGS